jgi:hypothetical protein
MAISGYKYNPKHSYMFIHISKKQLGMMFFQIAFPHIPSYQVIYIYIPIPSYYSDI